MNKLWIAAYNLPTKSWTSGGTLADYDREHYDIFEVPASSHEGATRAARAMRQAQVRLTAAQKALLAALIESIPASCDPAARLGRLIEVEPAESRAAAALARKGLLSVFDPDTLQVRLSITAFNPSILALVAAEAPA